MKKILRFLSILVLIVLGVLLLRKYSPPFHNWLEETAPGLETLLTDIIDINVPPLRPIPPEIGTRAESDEELMKGRKVLEDSPSDTEEVLAEAHSHFEKAVEIDPDNLDAWMEKGIVNFERANYQGAVEDFRRALAIDKYHADAYYQRGRAYDAMEYTEKACKDYIQACGLDQERYNDYCQGCR